MSDEFIERRITTGLIVSTDYIKEINKLWNSKLLKSSSARLLSNWCFEYFRSYNKAPGKDIEGIFTAKLKNGLQQDKAEDIEEILEDLSGEHDRKHFNLDYLLDQTKQYFKERHLQNFVEEVKGELSNGDIVEAEKLANNYKPVSTEDHTAIDPFKSGSRIKKAFEEQAKPLVKFPKALGDLWDDQFTRDSFVALMGPEKRGKTFMLMYIAIRAMTQGCNVAFFQAGDMSENQQLKRICTYLCKRSDSKKYCGGMWIPTGDCFYNQTGTCEMECQEENDEVPFEGMELEEVRKLPFSSLVEAAKTNKEYQPCRNCKNKRKGVPWLKWKPATEPITWKDAIKRAREFRKKHSKRMKLVTYPNETLTVMEIRSLLDTWEKQENFVPDVVVIDYADILAFDPDATRMDFRHQTNRLWQRLRSLASEKHILVVTATQASARSYSKKTMNKTDFSEDKRKFAHVTSMFGLNQTDDEKRIGVLRINEIVIREGDFDTANQVKVLQRLQMGSPYLGSFW